MACQLNREDEALPSLSPFLDDLSGGDHRSIAEEQPQQQQPQQQLVVAPAAEPSSDDSCGVCNDGGELICCDSCPSTFHPRCVGLSMIPQSSQWFCPGCLCSVCAHPASPRSGPLVTCSQCERRFHSSCRRMNGAPPPFCSPACRKLFTYLTGATGVRRELGQGKNVRWMLLRKGYGGEEKLAEAEMLFKWRFIPIVDSLTGLDYVNAVVHSRESVYRRLHFPGFYTAVILVGDRVVCAAAIRVRDQTLAEIPLVATSCKYEGQGMCRKLMSALEAMLVGLGVERIVLLTMPEAESIWRDAFKYKTIEKRLETRRAELNLLFFTGSSFLQKNVERVVSVSYADMQRPRTSARLARRNGVAEEEPEVRSLTTVTIRPMAGLAYKRAVGSRLGEQQRPGEPGEQQRPVE